MPDRFKQGDLVTMVVADMDTTRFTFGRTYVVQRPCSDKNDDHAYWFEEDDRGESNAWYGRCFDHAVGPW